MMPANILFLSTSPVGTRVEEILLKVIVQIVVIMAAARIFATVFRWVGQPTVCGEIAAGLILGPSLFGGLFPHLFERVFDTSVGPIFSVLSQIGLILLLFLIGLEFEFSHLRKHGHQALIISIAGMVLPFGFGLGVSHVLYPYVGAGINRMGFVLFIATALSITALPILLMVGETVGFALFMIVVARPLLIRWSRRTLQENKGELSLTSLAVLLILIFISAAVTNLIGIFSIFGGFIMGAILYDQHELCDAIRRRLRDFVTVFFLPIFFTYTGLRTDIGTMQGGFLWTLCGLVLMAGIVGKLAGCTIAANLSGFSRRESWIVGVLMNTRALMALIAINIGYELGLLPK